MAKLAECFRWRTEGTVFFREIPAPIHPAKDTSQAAPTGIAGRDSPIDTSAVEFRVLTTITATDNLLGLSGKFQRVKGGESRLQISLVSLTKGGHYVLSFSAGWFSSESRCCILGPYALCVKFTILWATRLIFGFPEL